MSSRSSLEAAQHYQFNTRYFFLQCRQDVVQTFVERVFEVHLIQD